MKNKTILILLTTIAVTLLLQGCNKETGITIEDIGKYYITQNQKCHQSKEKYWEITTKEITLPANTTHPKTTVNKTTTELKTRNITVCEPIPSFNITINGTKTTITYDFPCCKLINNCVYCVMDSKDGDCNNYPRKGQKLHKRCLENRKIKDYERNSNPTFKPRGKEKTVPRKYENKIPKLK